MELEIQIIDTICQMYRDLISGRPSRVDYSRKKSSVLHTRQSSCQQAQSVTTSEVMFGDKMRDFRKIFDEY